ncbi:FtsK/SpoIIIE family [Bacillus thuringiensis serovar israelensis ATCC 35646]|nr:FtsK/SpoIIIE family [Bacillus thuringiensis serovar israelensis ATCC 35646]
MFPQKQGSLLFKFVGLLIIIFLWGALWEFLEISTLRMNILGGLINPLLSGTFIVLWFITTYFSVRGYLGLFKRNKSWIANNLVYMINSLKLYDEEYFETTKNDKVVREKRIVRVIRIQYRETSKHIVVRILRDGDRFTNEATKLGENLESALGLELDSTNKAVDYAEYVFLKNKDKRIDLNSTVTSMNGSDEIKITENISYELHKVPHSLIVGGTGSGKSFFILGKIVSY